MGRVIRALRLLVAGAVLLLAACGASDAPALDLDASDLQALPSQGAFDYQLGGAYDPAPGGGPERIDVVVRDAGEQPLPGAYSICYVNGFQTQPDQSALWQERPDALLHDDAGSPVHDPDWPDEMILDPSSAAQRDRILEVIGPEIRGCADAGYDAVEIDNLDTATRFPQIDQDGALALAASYVGIAHEEGLAIGQKNAAELSGRAQEELGFDLAVVEECGAYDECAAYTDVYGDQVLQVEYPDSLAAVGLTFAQVCARADRAPMTILRDRELVAPAEPGYRYEAC